ncbi:MAG TPA: CHRD domain-containing protein [Acidobacteriota bacterium]|nr:CHRD domain-containing protein [Acidobacteriota bacterium]
MRSTITIGALVGLILVCVSTPLAAQAVYRFNLDGSQEVPKVATLASGRCVGALSSTFDELELICSHDVADPVSAHIHNGARGTNGAPIMTFDSAVSPMSGTWSLSALDFAALMSGNLYVNIHSPNNPGGEIRGQIDALSLAGVRFSLDGSEVVPPVETMASGNCIGALDPLELSFAIGCVQDVVDPTAAAIHHAPGGQDGPAIFAFDAATTFMDTVTFLFSGDTTANGGVEYDWDTFLRSLRNNELYVEVSSVANPEGEIRGQIPSPGFLSYLPQFINGSGLTTELVVTNSSKTETASGYALFSRLNGELWPVGIEGDPGPPSFMYSFMVPPQSSVTIATDGLGVIDESINEGLGSAAVRSDVPVSAMTRFVNPDGTSLAAAVESDVFASAIGPVVVNDSQNTAVAILNVTTRPIDVTLRLTNSGDITVEKTMSLAPYARVARYIDEIFEGINFSDFSGTLIITGEDGVFAAIALEQLGASKELFTSLPLARTLP